MDKKKILIIDDEKSLCLLMKLNMESTGEYEVTTVNSGMDGLEKVKQSEYDLVITDYKMPGMDGKQVLAALKEMRPNEPVVLFSVYHDDSSEISSDIRALADGIISKPIDHKRLHEVINRVLAKKDKPK